MNKRKAEKKDACLEKCTLLEAKLQRALADYDNLEKRVLARCEALTQEVKAEVLDKLVSVLDDFDRAQVHLKDAGLGLAINQFRSVLRSEGLVEVEAQGQTFDPEKMDCVGMVAGTENQVVSVLEKGYELEGKVVRPAKVEVGAGQC